MPLISIEKSKEKSLGIWRVTEELSEMESRLSLSRSDKSKFEKITHQQKQKQFLATRLLINEFAPNIKVEYKETGKPYLSNSNENISISHSHDLISVIISPKPCGIDIEKISEKPWRLQERFLNKDELFKLRQNSNHETATLFWSAKEAVYKMAGIQGLFFKNDIIIKDINTDADNFLGQVQINEEKINLKFRWRRISDYILVYVME